jgi:hypothetical protein
MLILSDFLTNNCTTNKQLHFADEQVIFYQVLPPTECAYPTLPCQIHNAQCRYRDATSIAGAVSVTNGTTAALKYLRLA